MQSIAAGVREHIEDVPLFDVFSVGGTERVGRGEGVMLGPISLPARFDFGGVVSGHVQFTADRRAGMEPNRDDFRPGRLVQKARPVSNSSRSGAAIETTIAPGFRLRFKRSFPQHGQNGQSDAVAENFEEVQEILLNAAETRLHARGRSRQRRIDGLSATPHCRRNLNRPNR